MFHIRVERVVNKDIQTVFEAIADHENYSLFPSIDLSVLLEEGREERNGEGAVRRIGSGAFKVLERVTHFERPTRMDYRIEQSSPLPLRHDKGEIRLMEEGDVTRVVWVSEGHITIPVLGNFLDKPFQKNGTALFHAMLKSIETRKR